MYLAQRCPDRQTFDAWGAARALRHLKMRELKMNVRRWYVLYVGTIANSLDDEKLGFSR